MSKSSAESIEKVVDFDLVAKALAKAMCTGDIVNFRSLFAAFSPARQTSGEVLESEKYAYLLPDQELQSDGRYGAALEAVRSEATWAHIQTELAAERPAQLPSDLVLILADSAVREKKFTVAAQAYELLRVRNKMQEEFLKQAHAALDAGDIEKGVRGYLIAAGLSYDYAAFPEPLPVVPNYQTKALMLHGIYPSRPEDCVSLRDEESHLNVALDYLVHDEEIAGRLRSYSLEARLEILKELVQQIDPEWDAFVGRFNEACGLVQSLGERFRRDAAPHTETLQEEIEDQQSTDPRQIMSALLGREIENGEWWQYLKELGYQHPASVLFIARQLVGDDEIIVPRLLTDSSVPRTLGLVAPSAGHV